MMNRISNKVIKNNIVHQYHSQLADVRLIKFTSSRLKTDII